MLRIKLTHCSLQCLSSDIIEFRAITQIALLAYHKTVGANSILVIL